MDTPMILCIGSGYKVSWPWRHEQSNVRSAMSRERSD